MTPHVLIIEGEAVSADASACRFLAHDESLTCARVAWEDFDPGRTDGVALVVAVAVPSTPVVSNVFAWLRSRPLPVSTFAVLPSDANDDLLRLAIAAVDDFICAPIRDVELRHRLTPLLEPSQRELATAGERLLADLGLQHFVGQDAVFLRAVAQVPRYARADLPVLVVGETGTGKELCARALHDLGNRRDGPFIPVNCGAIPDQIFENELFGHARGAFTDAHRDQKGLIAMAEGGTLFLDEVDALSLPTQAKLLRFLQEHTYRPLGSDRIARADVRVVAATNRDLEQHVRDKQFRCDLYFRLNVLHVNLPPLRDRRSDIALLAQHLLQELDGHAGTPPRFSPDALGALGRYDWPGNVRELCSVIQRAALACDDGVIGVSHLTIPCPDAAAEPAGGDFRSARAAAVAEFERRYVEDSLRRHRGNVTRAAREAGQERRAFGRLIKKHRVDRSAL